MPKAKKEIVKVAYTFNEDYNTFIETLTYSDGSTKEEHILSPGKRVKEILKQKNIKPFKL